MLLVHAVVLLRLIMFRLLTYFLTYGFLTFPISIDNRETLANVEQVGSFPLLDENGEKVHDALDLLVFLSAAYSLVLIFWSVVLVLFSIFSFWLVTPFLKTNLGIAITTLKKKSKVWSSFYRSAYWKWFEQILVYLLTWNVFLFPGESMETLFTSFVQVFMYVFEK